MKALRDAAGQDLQWTGDDELELCAGVDVFARLRAREKGADWIVGEAVDGQWALKDRHIGSGEILVIVELDSPARIATVKRGRNHGLFARDRNSIEFGDGRLMQWKKASTWHEDWDWVDSHGEPLLHFQRGRQVVIEPLARLLPELSLLVLAGRQLLTLQEVARKKAAVAGVAATVASRVVVSC